MVRGYRHFPWINLNHLLICSVYENGSLQNYFISKLLMKHVLLFSQYSSNWCYGSLLKCVNKITWVSIQKSKKVIHDTLFKVCTFYFHTKWLSNWEGLISEQSVQYRPSPWKETLQIRTIALYRKTDTLCQIKI